MNDERRDFDEPGDGVSTIEASIDEANAQTEGTSVETRPFTKKEAVGMAILGTVVVGGITVGLPLSGHLAEDHYRDARLETAEAELDSRIQDEDREEKRELEVTLRDQEEQREATAKVKFEYLSQSERNDRLANSLSVNGQRLIDAYSEGHLPVSSYEGYDPDPEDGIKEEHGHLYGKIGKYNYTLEVERNDAGDLVPSVDNNAGIEIIDTDLGLSFQISGAPGAEWEKTENNPDLTGIWSVALSEIEPSEEGYPEFGGYSSVPFATSEDHIAGWSNPSVYEVWSPKDEAALGYPGGAIALDNAVTAYLSEFGNAVTYVSAANR